MSEEREPFFERWSRLKTQDREGAREAELPTAPSPAKAEEAPPLPKVEDLTPQADFRPFMNADVDPLTRRTALKRLFADAHFNVPDPFEPYSADLTGGEAISPEMLKTLNQAKKLLFDEQNKSGQAELHETQAEEPKMPVRGADDGGRSADA